MQLFKQAYNSNRTVLTRAERSVRLKLSGPTENFGRQTKIWLKTNGKNNFVKQIKALSKLRGYFLYI